MLSMNWKPSWKDLEGYHPARFRSDLQAGVTVAIFAVPQAMAYAILAGVPPVHGLYAAIVMSIVAALWGSSSFVNTGPTNSASLLTAAALLPYAREENFLAILFTFTLMVGVIRLAMGLLRMGKLIDFVPESAFLGFTVGAGLLIALGQLHHLLGVPGSEASWFVRRMVDVLQRAPDLNGYTLAIGLGVLAIMLALDRFNRRFPVALVAIGLAAGVAFLLGEAAAIPLVRDIAPIQAGLPAFTLPYFHPDIFRTLWPGALAVSIIGLIEAVSIGQTLALKHGRHLDFDREFIGQGLSHIVSAFFQGLPGSGSFSRSALIEQCGAHSRMANVVFGLATALALLLVPGLLNLIPISALAGLLLFIGYKLVDARRIRRVLATSTPDLWVMALTFFTTVFIRIEYGIFVGILLGALLYLRRTHRLHLVELVPDKEHFHEVPYDGHHTHEPSDLVVLGMGGDLYYGVSHLLRERLATIVETQRPRHLVLRIRRAFSIDYSCWSAIFDFAERFEKEGGNLYLCGTSPDLRELLDSARMGKTLPADQVYSADAKLFLALNTCTTTILGKLDRDAQLSGPWSRLREVSS